MNRNLITTIFNAIAVAMGVAVIVLNIVNPQSFATNSMALAVGVTALGIAALQKN